jgi:hypothetical protein
VTRGFGAVGVACPACEHRTVAPKWSKKPGMLLFPLAGPETCLRAGSLITSGRPQMITIAPLLMVTLGPAMMMLAPLPFWM